MQPVPDRREPRPLQQPDEPRQRPHAQRIRAREAILHPRRPSDPSAAPSPRHRFRQACPATSAARSPSSQSPRCSVARVASIRASSRSWSSSRNTLTSLAINILRCSSVTVRACRIATPFGCNCAIRLPQPQLPPRQRRRPGRRLQIRVVQRLRPRQHRRRHRAHRPRRDRPQQDRDTAAAPTGSATPTRPAARATINSLDRVSRQNARIPPSSTANGRICIVTNGIRSTGDLHHQRRTSHPASSPSAAAAR